MIELGAGDWRLHVDEERGLDVGAAWFRHTLVSWLSPLYPSRWQGDFARSFGGGLVVTCGLRNVGVPSEGQPQHGWYSSLPARDVEAERNGVGARIVEAEVPGETLELRRELRIDGASVRIVDTTTNLGPQPVPAPLLYHCNFPWGEPDSDAEEVRPRDADAARIDWRELGDGRERVYEHVGATRGVVAVRGVRLIVASSLPRLWQWTEPSYPVLAFEPANCSVLGRAHDRAEGRLPQLAPREERITTLTITAEGT